MLFALAIGAGCEDSNEKQTVPMESAHVIDVIVDDTISGVDQYHYFEAVFGLSNSCETYKKTEKTKNDSSTYFDIIIHNPSYNDGDVACQTKPYTDTIELRFLPKFKGNHRLFFNDSSLVKETEILK
jgi:hypothetical protein